MRKHKEIRFGPGVSVALFFIPWLIGVIEIIRWVIAGLF